MKNFTDELIVITILVLSVLFAGDPDLMDSIIGDIACEEADNG